MKKLIFLAAIVALWQPLQAQTGIPVPTMTGTDNLIKNFLSNYGIPAATVAIAKDGKIVYHRAFGKSDVAGTINTQPYNLFRIASLSKPVTSIGLMRMIQAGMLSPTDKVFGPTGILKDHPVFSSASINDARIYNITVQQLLEHTAGWNRDINCNPNPSLPYTGFRPGCDPIGFPLRAALLTGTPNPVSENALITFLLEKGLNFNPGSAYNYSNIGYLILGAVIEKISGKSYENYMKKDILEPLGIYDMHIGKNLRSEKMEREGEYVGNGGTIISCYDDNKLVPWEYGGLNINAMGAHGGWIATSRDLLKLLAAADGFITKPDILSASTLNYMTTPSTANAYYAKGFQVNANNNWWHTGSLDGTAAEIVRTYHGYTWIIILNKRSGSPTFWSALDNLGWQCINNTTTWPEWDLMENPTQNAHTINFYEHKSNSVMVTWTKGDGNKRLVVAHADTGITHFPLDGTDYTANESFGSGDDLGNGNFVVYNGTGNNVTVTGLNPGINYYFRVIEYNKNTTTGNNALYLLGGNPTDMTRAGLTYTFVGNGNWTHAANWRDNYIPPAVLPANANIIINPQWDGECILNTSQVIANGGSLRVINGKKFRVNGNLINGQ